jgi:hypothetical protein
MFPVEVSLKRFFPSWLVSLRAAAQGPAATDGAAPIPRIARGRRRHTEANSSSQAFPIRGVRARPLMKAWFASVQWAMQIRSHQVRPVQIRMDFVLFDSPTSLRYTLPYRVLYDRFLELTSHLREQQERN